MSFHTEAPWVTSTFNHLDGWWLSLGLVSTFSFAGVFCVDLAVVGVAVMPCFLGSAVGSAGVFLLFWFSTLISDSSEWTNADTHSFSDGGGQRLESMRAATVVLTRSAGLSLFRLVMVHYRIVVHFCHFNSFFFTPLSPPISPAYLLLVHCVLCMDGLASTPPSQHKYTHLPKYNIFFCKCV